MFGWRGIRSVCFVSTKACNKGKEYKRKIGHAGSSASLFLERNNNINKIENNLYMLCTSPTHKK
jgi:hypothetical protein